MPKDDADDSAKDTSNSLAILKVKHESEERAVFSKDHTERKIKKLATIWNIEEEEKSKDSLVMGDSIYDLAFWAFYKQ